MAHMGKTLSFAFGKNWQSFVHEVTESRISNAQTSLLRLFPDGELVGKPFFDIGCGSGLSMLAALRAGASEAIGIDADQDSVAATKALLTKHAANKNWRVEHKSVFDLAPVGTRPVVHSWGVLHHTGNMNEATRKAAETVAPGGIFALSIYRKTTLCPLWKAEKAVYFKAPSALQSVIAAGYKSAYLGALLLTGRNPAAYINNYNSERGMSWSHDVHDWLGGYPYESASPTEIRSALPEFEVVRSFERPGGFGLFGSGCNEYVFRRK